MSKPVPKISVVLPTYNRRDVLPRAIASVLAQDERDFELIIVDDCSSDDTQAYLASLTDMRIRTLRPAHNLGPAGARNFGLEAARADFVAFLDSDDVYLPKRLDASIAAFARDRDVVAALSSCVRYDLKRERVVRIPEMTLASPQFEWALFSDLIGVDGSGITVRRQTALEIGGFCQTLRCIEDREFLIRMARRGRGHLIAEPLWAKYWSTDGLSVQWERSGAQLVDYVAVRPEFTGEFRRLGSYFATKILIADLRHGMFGVLWRDVRAFAKADLIDGNIVRLVRYHRQVRRYRREMSQPERLATISGPPTDWH